MAVKDIIRNRRIELGLTMKELADAVGVSEGTISRWESGHIANMRRDKIVTLAKVLQISPSTIMEWDNNAEGVHTDVQAPEYYKDKKAAEAAQKVFSDPNYRILFDAADGSTSEDLLYAAEMLRRLKGNN